MVGGGGGGDGSVVVVVVVVVGGGGDGASVVVVVAGGGLGGLPSVTFTVFTGRLGDVAIGGLPGMPETCRSYVFVAMPVTVTVAT